MRDGFHTLFVFISSSIHSTLEPTRIQSEMYIILRCNPIQRLLWSELCLCKRYHMIWGVFHSDLFNWPLRTDSAVENCRKFFINVFIWVVYIVISAQTSVPFVLVLSFLLLALSRRRVWGFPLEYFPRILLNTIYYPRLRPPVALDSNPFPIVRTCVPCIPYLSPNRSEYKKTPDQINIVSGARLTNFDCQY